jgi:DNA-directed RNA polymerase specialized sigma24 family protein
VTQAIGPASPEARAALAELCGAYWYPIYAFIRRTGHDPDEALDLTQDYFMRLLEIDVLASAEHRLGRFRAFLRTDCGFFLSHHHEKRRAIKRGGDRTELPIDARDAEGRYLAARMGTSEGAVQQAVHRLRKRYKAILRERIAATLHSLDESAIDDEIRDLFSSLAN